MIKKNLDNLTSVDLYSLSMFLLFKLQDVPTYSTVSELPYILDKDSLLTLCEYYGGQTIKIPTTQELYEMLNVIVLYQKVNIEGQQLEEAISKLHSDYTIKPAQLKHAYYKLCEVLKDYDIHTRARYN